MTSRSFVTGAELWCVLLAAGGSSRLGYPKQLLRDPVRPLLLRAVDAALTVAPDQVVVVVGAHALRMRSILSRNFGDLPVVCNGAWNQGISTSLRAGIGVLPQPARGALIMLTDQVRVDSRDLARLANEWRRQPSAAIAARYNGEIGVPAILPRRLWARLSELEGDRGAKALLEDDRTRLVDMPSAAVDIDTAEDRRRFEDRIV
jgi:molybdenum cofactor cytidylyltransferase